MSVINASHKCYILPELNDVFYTQCAMEKWSTFSTENSKENVEWEYSLIESSPSIFIAFCGQQTWASMISHHGKLLTLGSNTLQRIISSNSEPERLAIRTHQPERQSRCVSTNGHFVLILIDDAAQVTFARVGEVVQVVSSGQALSEDVTPVHVKQVEFVIDGRGNLIHVERVEERFVLPDISDAYVTQVGDEEFSIRRNRQWGGRV